MYAEHEQKKQLDDCVIIIIVFVRTFKVNYGVTNFLTKMIKKFKNNYLSVDESTQSSSYSTNLSLNVNSPHTCTHTSNLRFNKFSFVKHLHFCCSVQ